LVDADFGQPGGLGQLGVDRGIVEVGQSRRILRLMHGLGWVTVRFATKDTPPGPVWTFASDDPALHRVWT
jgi:hypothetical protein